VFGHLLFFLQHPTVNPTSSRRKKEVAAIVGERGEIGRGQHDSVTNGRRFSRPRIDLVNLHCSRCETARGGGGCRSWWRSRGPRRGEPNEGVMGSSATPHGEPVRGAMGKLVDDLVPHLGVDAKHLAPASAAAAESHRRPLREAAATTTES
jgi:hypothetical protein